MTYQQTTPLKNELLRLYVFTFIFKIVYCTFDQSYFQILHDFIVFGIATLFSFTNGSIVEPVES